nr:superinfection immunity protein [Pseudomonas sp. PS01303]
MALYFFPAICSIRTKSKARASTFKLNFLAGWTGLGWILAFYMAKVLPLDDDKI